MDTAVFGRATLPTPASHVLNAWQVKFLTTRLLTHHTNFYNNHTLACPAIIQALSGTEVEGTDGPVQDQRFPVMEVEQLPTIE